MCDNRWYGNHYVTFDETSFSVDVGKPRYSIHHAYKDVDNAGVYDSDKAWRFQMPVLRRGLGILFIIIGVMGFFSGDETAMGKGFFCVVAGIIALVVWNKEFVVKIKMNNGNIISLKMPKDPAYAFCNDLNNRITKAKQNTFSSPGNDGGQVKSDVFKSRWERAERVNNQNDEVSDRSSYETLKTDGSWFCPGCGRVNSEFVTICICGWSKDGNNVLATRNEVSDENKTTEQEISENKTEVQTKFDNYKKWRCKKCRAINDGKMRICPCGTPREDTDDLNKPSDVSKGKKQVLGPSLIKQYLGDNLNNVKFSFKSEVVRVKIQSAYLRQSDSGKCELAFTGTHAYDNSIDALLCFVRLQDAFDEIYGEAKLNYSVVDFDGKVFIAEYEPIEFGERRFEKIKKVDIEVLKVAFK